MVDEPVQSTIVWENSGDGTASKLISRSLDEPKNTAVGAIPWNRYLCTYAQLLSFPWT